MADLSKMTFEEALLRVGHIAKSASIRSLESSKSTFSIGNPGFEDQAAALPQELAEHVAAAWKSNNANNRKKRTPAELAAKSANEGDFLEWGKGIVQGAGQHIKDWGSKVKNQLSPAKDTGETIGRTLTTMPTDPHSRLLASTLVGAGIGGGAGLLSTLRDPKEKRRYGSRFLTGAALGGMGGASANWLWQASNNQDNVKVDPRQQQNMSVALQAGVEAARHNATDAELEAQALGFGIPKSEVEDFVNNIRRYQKVKYPQPSGKGGPKVKTHEETPISDFVAEHVDPALVGPDPHNRLMGTGIAAATGGLGTAVTAPGTLGSMSAMYHGKGNPYGNLDQVVDTASANSAYKPHADALRKARDAGVDIGLRNPQADMVKFYNSVQPEWSGLVRNVEKAELKVNTLEDYISQLSKDLKANPADPKLRANLNAATQNLSKAKQLHGQALDSMSQATSLTGLRRTDGKTLRIPVQSWDRKNYRQLNQLEVPHRLTTRAMRRATYRPKGKTTAILSALAALASGVGFNKWHQDQYGTGLKEYYLSKGQ